MSCDARGGAVFIVPAIFDVKLLGSGFGISGARAGAAAVPIGIPPANLSEPLLAGDGELGSVAGGFWIRNAGAFSRGFVSVAPDAICLSCSASNNDVGTAATGLAGAGASKLATATGTAGASCPGCAEIVRLGTGIEVLLVPGAPAVT